MFLAEVFFWLGACVQSRPAGGATDVVLQIVQEERTADCTTSTAGGVHHQQKEGGEEETEKKRDREERSLVFSRNEVGPLSYELA